MLSISCISLGGGSAVSCRLCSEPVAPSYRPAEEITSDIAAALAADPESGILLTGPEPFGHPALPALVGAALKGEASRLGVTTSAAALAQGDNATGSVAAGLRFIEVPLLGASPGAHDPCAGAPGAFEAAGAGIQRFRAAGDAVGATVAVRGRVDVCAHTLPALPEMVVVLAKWGASSIELRCNGRLEGRGLEHVRAACETGIVNAVWVAVTGVDPAVLGPHVLHATDVLEFRGGVS